MDATDLRNVIPRPVTLAQPPHRRSHTVVRRFVSVATQTEPQVSRTRRTVTRTVRFHEKGKRVKETTVDETDFVFESLVSQRDN